MATDNVLEHVIDLAEKALTNGNYPCAAVITDDKGNILAEGLNECHTSHDITAHAEIRCLQGMDSKRLSDSEEKFHITTSTEPCGGCSFFIARCPAIQSITWALTDPQKVGFDDFSKDNSYRELFSHITVFAEPVRALRDASAKLFRAYYERRGDTKKALFYT